MHPNHDSLVAPVLNRHWVYLTVDPQCHLARISPLSEVASHKLDPIIAMRAAREKEVCAVILDGQPRDGWSQLNAVLDCLFATRQNSSCRKRERAATMRCVGCERVRTRQRRGIGNRRSNAERARYMNW
jgi:hypothetical protein